MTKTITMTTTAIYLLMIIAIFVSASVSASAIPQPVSWWTFDNNHTISTTAVDVVSGINGTLRNGVVSGQTGILNESYLFDGANDDVQIPDDPKYDMTEISIELWWNSSAVCSGRDRIFTMIGPSVSWDLTKNCAGANNIEWTLDSSGSGGTTITSASQSKGVWHHVIVSGSLTNMTIYIDGVSSASSAIAKTGNYNAEDFLYVGSQDGTADYFQGFIDNVKLYNVTINATTAEQLYNNGSGVPFSPPVNNPPSKAVLQTPANNSIVTSAINLSWTASVDPEASPITYTVVIDNIIRNTTLATSVLFNTNILTDANHTWYVNASDGTNTNKSSSFRFDSDNTAPVFVKTYPTNVLNWGNGSITGQCLDNHPFSVSYNFTNQSLHNITNVSLNPLAFDITIHNIDEPAHNHTITFTCTDAVGLTTKNTQVYNFDLVSPFCLPVDPIITVFRGNSYLWNMSCIDDENLYSINISCTGGPNTQISLVNLNVTQYQFVQNTGPITSDMACQIITADAHTDNDIRDRFNRFTVAGQNGNVRVPENDAIVSFSEGSVQKDVSLDFSKDDRVSFSYTFDPNAQRKVRDYVFYVSGKERVSYIQNNKYPAWFVVDNQYWVDFNSPNRKDISYSVEQINRTRYAVTVKTTLDRINFTSVGIVNINTQNQQFIVLDQSPLFSSAILSAVDCPDNLNQVIMLIFLTLFVIAIITIGYFASNMWAMLLGSLGLIALSLNYISCQTVVGMIMLIVGIVSFFLSFFVRKPKDWLERD